MTIAELEIFFEPYKLSTESIYLDPSTKVNNISQFIESHLGPLNIDPHNKINQPLIERLLRLKELLEQKQATESGF